MTIKKLCKNAIKCHQAEFCSSIRLDFTAERLKQFTLLYEVKIIFWNFYTCILICPVYTNHRSIGKSVTVEFSFKRNFICPQAELISSNYLLKAKEIEMSHVTFKSMTLLYETSTITIRTSMPKNAKIKCCYGTRPDTRPIPVADGWAGAEMRGFPLFDSSVTDRRTDQRTDGQSLL